MRRFVLLLLLLVLPAAAPAEAQPLLRTPALSRTQIVFTYAGDLWIVGREGGDARRLTTGAGIETDPAFSPDGQWVAFTGQYDGNEDVYLVPAAGGAPRRLTWHPGIDRVVGLDAGRQARALPLRTRQRSRQPAVHPAGPKAGASRSRCRFPWRSRALSRRTAAASPTCRAGTARHTWQLHRLEALPRRADLADLDRPPRGFRRGEDPARATPTTSTRCGSATASTSSPTATGRPRCTSTTRPAAEVKLAIANLDGPDIDSASAGPDAIVYEQLGADPPLRSRHGPHEAGGDPRLRRPAGRAAALRQDRRPHSERRSLAHGRAGRLRGARRDPHRAGGEGRLRNLTRTPGVAERDPAWSPDGKSIAYFSDESGEYALHIASQTGSRAAKTIPLGEPPSFFYSPRWSPDGKKIAYTDKRLNLWYVDVAKGRPVRVDADLYETPFRPLEVSLVAGQQLARLQPGSEEPHARRLPLLAGVGQVHPGHRRHERRPLRGLRQERQVPLLHRQHRRRPHHGLARHVQPAAGRLAQRLRGRARQEPPSPLAPESDEEKDRTDKTDGTEKTDEKNGKGEKGKEAEPPAVKVDFEDIGPAHPRPAVPARNYVGLMAGKEGVVFVLESAPVRRLRLQRRRRPAFRPGERARPRRSSTGPRAPSLSANGEKMLCCQGEAWFIVGTAAAPKPGEGALALDDAQVRVDPQAEWRQMYREVWRIERDFLYDPGLHGLDLAAARKRYEPYLDGIGHRRDLNALFNEMLGELTVGHVYVAGGDKPEVPSVPGRSARRRLRDRQRPLPLRPHLQRRELEPGPAGAAHPAGREREGRRIPARRRRPRAEGHGQRLQLLRGHRRPAGRPRGRRRPDGKGSREVTVVPVENEGGCATSPGSRTTAARSTS